ncbi:MAG: LPS-assembly protein LptD [Lentisphaeria bacterium]|nr:LPS-assembly protein LptD [Lentisphaeria bacterium]
MKNLITIFLILLIGIFIPMQFCEVAAKDINTDAANDDLQNISADKWTWIGNNIILEGNVHLSSKNLNIQADKVIINTENHGFETFGDTLLLTRKNEITTLNCDELARLKQMADVKVDLLGVTFDNFGNPALKASVYYLNDKMNATKVLGNLKSGYLRFENAECVAGSFTFTAESGVRKADGNMTLKGAEISTCEYLPEDKAHYSMAASEINLYTYQNNGYDMANYDFSIGQHAIHANNALLKIYDIPIFWLPAFYKPKDESPGLFDFSVGYNSDWGVFVSLFKKIQITDYPYSSINLLADYYSERGFGYGANVEIKTENSKTELFMYGIYDMDPIQDEDMLNLRFDIPHWRYDVRLTNVSHLTNRLDLRANVEFLSDLFFRDDFFHMEYKNNPEPASYVALEQQFDYLTMSLYLKMQTNDFLTTSQRLPEFRIDVPRVEIFNTNLYYQGEHSINYSIMNWRNFDKPRRVYNFTDVDNYDTMRLDTVNFLYFPINLGFLNIIPRAGVRMTVYSDTSDTAVSSYDLNNMFLADSPYENYPANVVNYTPGGGAKVRFLGEFGVEANTKIHGTFNNVRSDFFRLDGLRHIMVPYVNYTYITPSNVDRDNIYYFDDIDRIDEQHFFRIGVKNRLQTRSNNRLINTFEMENYITLFLNKEEEFHRVGDFATKLTASPIKGLTISTLFSINLGGENDYGRGPSFRNSKIVERKGITGSWLNRWTLDITYEPIKDFIFTLGYVYNDSYADRSVYSMGSHLSEIMSGSAFDKFYNMRIQAIRAGIGIPLSKDRRTRLAYQIRYDFEEGFVSNQRIGFIHTLHCWEFAVFFAQTTSWDDEEKQNDYSVSFTATLKGVVNPLQEARGEMPDLFRIGTGDLN